MSIVPTPFCGYSTTDPGVASEPIKGCLLRPPEAEIQSGILPVLPNRVIRAGGSRFARNSLEKSVPVEKIS